MSKKTKKQEETEAYLSKIKLKEIFQGLLTHVIAHQPEDPITYFHEEITKIKKEMEESDVDIASTTFLTTAQLTTDTDKQCKKLQNEPETKVIS